MIVTGEVPEPSEAWSELGGEPAPGSTESLRSMAGELARRSAQAEALHVQLQRLGLAIGDTGWEGESADEFEARFGGIHDALAALQHDHEQVRQRLLQWADSLDELQAQARALLREAADSSAASGVAARHGDLRVQFETEVAAVHATIAELTPTVPLYSEDLTEALLARLPGALLTRSEESKVPPDVADLPTGLPPGWVVRVRSIAEAVLAAGDPLRSLAAPSGAVIRDATSQPARLGVTSDGLQAWVPVPDGWLVDDGRAIVEESGEVTASITISLWSPPDPRALAPATVSAGVQLAARQSGWQVDGPPERTSLEAGEGLVQHLRSGAEGDEWLQMSQAVLPVAGHLVLVTLHSTRRDAADVARLEAALAELTVSADD